MRVRKSISVLLSFVGTNDGRSLIGGADGAILTIFKERTFDEVHLFWNPTNAAQPAYKAIAEHIRSEIVDRQHSKSVYVHKFECRDVTDHNEIYPKLLQLCNSLGKGGGRKFTAAIASGTPAMQACWILMAESGDFAVDLIRSNEPRFGKPFVVPVRLGTSLPRIIRLETENKALRQETISLVPEIEIDIQQGSVHIAGIQVPLSPIEFSYYRYFVERLMAGESPMRCSGISAPKEFLEKIVKHHRESFPDSDLFRRDLEKMLKAEQDLDIRTFRANVSKTNSRIKKALSNPAWHKLFRISVGGKRHATTYGILVPVNKIRAIR